MENMASLLIRAFGDDYADFHDEPNNVSRGIFRAFINGCTKLFYKIAPGVDKTSALPLAKFLAIAINFGPDRALFAYKSCDQMWVKFASEFEDLFFYKHFIDDSFASAVPYLFNLRDLFNVYFRDWRFEPIDRKSMEDESAIPFSQDRNVLPQQVLLFPIMQALLLVQEELLLRVLELFLKTVLDQIGQKKVLQARMKLIKSILRKLLIVFIARVR
jgi:hypothetical protein